MITQKLIGVVAIATLFAEGTMPKKKDDKAPVAEEVGYLNLCIVVRDCFLVSSAVSAC